MHNGSHALAGKHEHYYYHIQGGKDAGNNFCIVAMHVPSCYFK